MPSPFSPVAAAGSIWRHRDLIAGMVRRDVLGRYNGSVLGLLWSFIIPLMMLAVYTFVFGVVFQARWDVGIGSQSEFAVVLFLGLIIYNLFAEMLNRSPGMILGNVNFVKKVVFPLEILPIIALLASLFHMSISLIVWLLAYLVFFGMPSPTALLFPLILMPLVLFSLGFSWFLASLGVYLRDTSQFIGVLTTVMLFLSPIFYPISILPPAFQTVLHLNPLTFIIEQSRGVLMWGQLPNWGGLVLLTFVAFGVACLGYAWFQKTRGGFADVL
jgi:lipopolysaccharide transport system permease protein